jgi:nicotinamide mononucleotide adenylyltransferase
VALQEVEEVVVVVGYNDHDYRLEEKGKMLV